MTDDTPDGSSRTNRIASYYRGVFARHGATPQGVNWNSDQAQQVRFLQLARILPSDGSFSVLDFGCGYGAFLPFLRSHWPNAAYTGTDVVPEMIATARTRHSNLHGVRFTFGGEKPQEADFAIFNGIFHVRQEEQTQSWEAYARATLHRVWQTTSQGIAFNVLSTYSDAERRAPHLYYGSPEDWFGWCVATFGRHVALLHDYGLHEFTLLVRKAPSSEEVSRQPHVHPDASSMHNGPLIPCAH